MKQETNAHFNAARLAFFLAVRYVTRTTLWQTLLVICVMTLTFLNLVVVSGVLVGLMDGSLQGYQRYYSGDLLVSKLPEKEYIERASAVASILSTQDTIAAFAPRIIEGGTLEANYLASVSQPNILPDRVGVSISGMDLRNELAVADVRERLVEGEFLHERDTTGIVIGARLLDRYFPAETGLLTISGVYPGDKVRLSVNGASREFTVRGIIRSKAGPIDDRVFMLDTELESLTGTYDNNIDEFAVRLVPGASPEAAPSRLLAYGIGSYTLVRTAEDVIGEFLDEIRGTFALLGNIIGAIAVIVASITIFIIIFITAITRRKYIGILKAIGISRVAIKLSYVLLSVFYSLIGISIGLLLLYLVLVPYFAANPIDFPFSDGILSVTTEGTLLRALILVGTTVIAGYFPARMIVNKNTLDAVLGR